MEESSQTEVTAVHGHCVICDRRDLVLVLSWQGGMMIHQPMQGDAWVEVIPDETQGECFDCYDTNRYDY